MIKITDARNRIRKFGDLGAGDAFIMDGDLYIKLYGGQFEAVSLVDGVLSDLNYDNEVTPVDIEINIVK